MPTKSQKVADYGNTSIRSSLIDVRDYDAIGDGATDDLAAFQNAVDALNTAGGGVLFVPEGTYILSDTLTLYVDNVWICGIGQPTLKRQDSSELLTSDHMINIGEGASNSASNVRLSNLIIDGNRANQSLLSTHNIRIENATDVLIENVESKNACYYGLHIRGEDALTKNIKVVDCYIHDCQRDCLDVKNQGSLGARNDNIIIDRVVCENPGLVTGINDACFDFRGPVVASNLIAKPGAVRNHGIRMRGTDNSSVEGRSTLTNFRIEASTGHATDDLLLIEGIENKVSNGHIEGGGNNGIQVQAARNMLTNIEVRDCDGIGVWLRNTGAVGERAHLVNVLSSSNGGNGFDIDTDNNHFFGCEARSNTGDGFNVASGADRNTFTACESSGNTGTQWNDSGAGSSPTVYRQATETNTLSSGGNISITFDTAFPNNCLGVVASIEGDPITTAEHLSVDVISTSGFTARHRPNPGAVSRTIRYLAWGN